MQLMPVCDNSLLPVFPDCPTPNYVGQITAGTYAARTSKSDRGYRSAMLLRCKPNGAIIECRWSAATQEQVCALMDFYHLCKEHWSFRLDKDHPIWCNVGSDLGACFVENEGEVWRWDSQPSFQPVVNHTNKLWSGSIKLVSDR